MCINNVDNKDNGLRKKMWSLDAKKLSVNQFWSKSLWQTAVFLLSNIYSKAYFVMPPVLVCKHSGEDHRFCCHRQGNSLHLNQKKKKFPKKNLLERNSSYEGVAYVLFPSSDLLLLMPLWGRREKFSLHSYQAKT